MTCTSDLPVAILWSNRDREVAPAARPSYRIAYSDGSASCVRRQYSRFGNGELFTT
jgi:hypothetical protein